MYIIYVIGTKTSDIIVPNTLVINGENVTVSNVGNGISSVFKDKNITGILTISDDIELNSRCFLSEEGITGITGTLGTVGNYAFDGCTGITTVTIKDEATVEDLAFYNCISANITIIGTPSSIGENVFYNCASVIVDNSRNEQMVRDSGYAGTILHSSNYVD